MRKFIISLLVIMALAFAFLPLVRSTGKESNAETFDAIIVLGSPATSAGLPGEVMAQRVSLGVDLFDQGVAPYLIFTGGAVANEHVESQVERQMAIDLGVPARQILTEGNSTNTYENAAGAVEIMKQNGFKSAAVVSSKLHLRRVRGIFSCYGIEFRTYGCDNPAGIKTRCRLFLSEQLKLCYHAIFGYSPDLVPDAVF